MSARNRARRRVLGFCVASFGLALSGCAPLGPDYQRPDDRAPDAWHQAVVGQMEGDDAPLHTWWQSLDDPALDALMERARQASPALAAAAASVSEAQARLRGATGERVPDLDARGGLTRQRSSEGVSEIVPPPQSRVDNFSSLGVSASWEIDFWGRVRRSVESASASYEAEVESYRDALVLLYANVAGAYVQARTLQRRLDLANANIELQRETLRLVTARNKAQLAPDLDIRQAELNLATTEAAVPALRAALSQTINTLAVLAGQTPDTMHAEMAKTAPIPAAPAGVRAGIPAETLRQRPDVRRAERLLAAQTARVGIAEAGRYPNFGLSGAFDYSAAGGSLVESGNEAWSIGPFFSWNLFDGGRVRSAIEIEDARTEQALAGYEQTVLLALQDVEDSLVRFAEERQRLAALTRAVDAAAASVELVKILYRSGLTNFQNVLDAERSLFNLQDTQAVSEGEVVQSVISIYRSLGGGWDAP